MNDQHARDVIRRIGGELAERGIRLSDGQRRALPVLAHYAHVELAEVGGSSIEYARRLTLQMDTGGNVECVDVDVDGSVSWP